MDTLKAQMLAQHSWCWHSLTTFRLSVFPKELQYIHHKMIIDDH